MSDGMEKVEEVTTTESEVSSEGDDVLEAMVVPSVSVEELQQSHEAREGNDVVNCIQIDISERDGLLLVQGDDGDGSAHSSATTTPLERSQEVEKDLLLVKEWKSLINLLARIPVKAQKGLKSFDLKLTCISTISDEILVIGTNVGVVYWYNRKTDVLDRLRCEGVDTVTCLNCISTVDYMVAAGTQSGLVTIFQIPRNPSRDRNSNSGEGQDEKKTKKSQQYLIQDLHKGAVTALEWSRNGMKLFSGDQTGHVVITDIDYDLVQIRSSVLICENYEIVQLSYARKSLLICSTFRSIIYSLESRDYSKVGSLERKIMGKFGGLIVSSAWEESPKVYSVRPGGRLWVADLSGVVKHTIKFKELMLSESQPEIHVIKPLRNPQQLQQDHIQFTRLFRFMKDYLVTYYKDILHIVDARNTIVLGTCKELRSVLDVAVNKDEIFILESSRNVIRLSAKPDKFSTLNFANSNILNATFSPISPSPGGISSTSSAFQPQVQSDSPFATEYSAGLKNLPDIMSASISDFRFPQEPINFLTSKFKETSERVIPRINPLINTIKTVIEADVDIEDGQKLLETGFPSPVSPLETGEIPTLDGFMSPEEPIFVPEPERFSKISNLPFEDVVVEERLPRKGKRSSKSNRRAITDVASDSVSVSSAYSNTSGSDNNAGVPVPGGWKGERKDGGNTSSSSSARKLSDATLSSSNSGSEAMSASEHSHLLLKDRLGVPLALSQSWSVGTLVPNKTVTKEELQLKEELLARRLKWPELLPESVSSDTLFDEILGSNGTGMDSSSPEETNQSWQVNLRRERENTDSNSDRASVLTLIGGRYSADEATDTDSRTLSMENDSFGTVIEREGFVQEVKEGKSKTSVKTASGSSSEADDEEDKYYMDIYTRYRSKDSISSYNSVLSFGPPSGSSFVSTGTGAFGGSLNAGHLANTNGTGTATSVSEAIPSSSNTDRAPPSAVEEELTNSKEKSGDTVTSSSSRTEELDSIVESKIVTDEYWRKWKLPVAITHISVCDHYIMCVSQKGTVYYARLNSVTLQWKMTNYSATTMAVSPCASIVWRIFKGDLYSLVFSSSEGLAPVSEGGEQWSKLTQKRDVLTATVQQSFGWVVKLDGSLEFCTGLLATRLIPYFEKVYTPWPIQEVTCCGHRLWALTSDGRIVFRTGTSDLNPKGIDWLEIRWGPNDEVPPACTISSGDVREDGVPSVWFSDASGNLYFTFDERDAKGFWIPWKVSGSNCVVPRNEQNCSKVNLSSIRDHVSKSLKSLVLQGSKEGLKICCSKHSVWFSGPESSIIFCNRSTITGHYWKPLRVDRGMTVPSTWANIYANSIYKGHGYLWIADSKGCLLYLPLTGGKLQRIDPPMFTDGQILSIAPAPEALWVLTSTGDIHGRCEITTMDPVGKSWRQISLSTLKSTQFVHISCGSEVAWAVDDSGEVFMRTGSLKPRGAQDMSPAWNQVESSPCYKGVFTKVYVGANDSMVWALDDKKRVFARQAIFPDYPIGTGWLLVKGVEAVMLSISDTAVWALSPNGDIYRRHGITKTNFVGDYWRKVPGNACAITVSLCDELWALSSDGYLLKHSKKMMTLKGWSNTNGSDVGSSGSTATKIVLDEEDEDWELVDNSEI